jgi:hypothetical protein
MIKGELVNIINDSVTLSNYAEMFLKTLTPAFFPVLSNTIRPTEVDSSSQYRCAHVRSATG